ncbi:hypothetical protein PHMEG_0002485 [Phytophthora megakarya]|uniref:Uncharacterized protein n=1 Tax=Phytophthora megakarya TaxID=4795 RepID=A0A225WYA4_9STRA|nr:hypothetical protein PHMEG_0002485 [Phytophthora megakarya]
MGKGPGWSEGETIQLCQSWLKTSEDAVVCTDQKRKSFVNRPYETWLENRAMETEKCAWRQQLSLSEVTQFCGTSAQATVSSSCGLVRAAIQAKWTTKITTDSSATAEHKAAGDDKVVSPIGRKAAKAMTHIHYVTATEKKADVMEQQLYMTVFMQNPQSSKPLEFFSIQHKTILVNLKGKYAIATDTRDQQPGSDQDLPKHLQAQNPTTIVDPASDEENEFMNDNINNSNNALQTGLV